MVAGSSIYDTISSFATVNLLQQSMTKIRIQTTAVDYLVIDYSATLVIGTQSNGEAIGTPHVIDSFPSPVACQMPEPPQCLIDASPTTSTPGKTE